MKIGIRAEDKSKWEARVPLVPEDIRKLAAAGNEIEVQSSPQRAFGDREYEQVDVPVRNEIDACQIIFGLKEIPAGKLLPDKIYFSFAHVIKGQSYNMPTLKQMMSMGITLVDYERIVDHKNRRLIFFGRHAGLAGMINSLWALGQRFSSEGCPNPLDTLRQARSYGHLSEARQAFRMIANNVEKNGVPDPMHPLITGFAGYGNVSTGAQEIFDLLPHREVRPQDLYRISSDHSMPRNLLYKVVFKEEDIVRPRESHQVFDLQEYYAEGIKKYESVFSRYLEHLTMLVNCIYWDQSYPRLMTLDNCRDLWADDNQPKLRVIGDISCDINGSIECTVKPSYPDTPLYVYHPDTGHTTDGVTGHGPVIMAVEILPAELPRESSEYFSGVLKQYIPEIAATDWNADFESIQLPPEIKRAVILYHGALTPDYLYLTKYL